MTTKDKHILCKNKQYYSVGDVVTIKKHKTYTYNGKMSEFNGIRVTIKEIRILDLSNFITISPDTSILKDLHKDNKILIYQFEESYDGLNDWNWYFYDFVESYRLKKVKLYNK